MTITLSAEDAKALAVIRRGELEAQATVELLSARATVVRLEAVMAKNRLWETLAEKYGFDPAAALAFDGTARTLTPVPAESA